MIPKSIREELEEDPFMRRCIYTYIGRGHECYNTPGRVTPEFEHSLIYGGKQLQERFAIVPVCFYHHRGGGMDKAFHQFVALCIRLTQTEYIGLKKKYPRHNWDQTIKFLNHTYKHLWSSDTTPSFTHK